MIKNIKIITLIIFWILCWEPSFANSSDFKNKITQTWRLREIPTNFSLLEHRVQDFFITPDSTVWMLHNDACSWYDGYRWNLINDSIFVKDPQPSRVVYENAVTVGFANEFYTIKNGSLFLVKKDTIFEMKLKFSGRKIKFEEVANNGNSLLLTGIQGGKKNLFIYEKKILKCYDLPEEILNGNIDFTLFNTSDKAIWLNAKNGIYLNREGSWKKILKSEGFINFSTPIKYGNQYLFYIGFPSKLSGLWSYSEENGIRIIDSLKIHMSSTAINNDNQILINNIGGEVELYDGNWHQLQSVPDIISGSYRLKFDINNDLWLAKEDKVYLMKLSSKLWNYWNDYDLAKLGFVNSFALGKNDGLWIATGGGIINLSDDGKKQIFEKIGNTVLEGTTTIHKDKYGKLWIGSGGYYSNTYVYDYKSWKKVELLPDSLKLRVHKIKSDSSGNLWFMTMSGIDISGGHGAIKYSNGKKEIWDKKRGLIHNRVYDFLEDETGAYWFGTYKGLSRFKDGEWKHWTVDNGLVYNRINSISQNPVTKEILFINNHELIGAINEDKVSYPEHLKQFHGKGLNELLFDDNSNIWISSKTGLWLVSNDAVLHYSKESGLSMNKTWPLLLSGDSLYIGTTGNGYSSLNTKYSDEYPPEIQLVLHGEYVQNHVDFQLYSYYGNFKSEDYYFKYTIDNGAWSQWFKGNIIQFKNNFYGKHKLTIKCMSPLGKVYEKNYTFDLKFDLPIYLRIEFVLSVTLLSLILVAVIIYFIKKRNEQLQDLIKAKNKLEVSERRYRHIIENASDGILMNKNGYIHFWNQQLLDMTGYSSDEVRGKPIEDFVAIKYKEKIIKLKELMQSGLEFPRRVEFQIVKKDRTNFWVDARIAKIELEDGYNSISVITDIDIRKQYERKLQDSLKKEQELNELKTNIISTISHEYRTPLTIMQTSVDLLKIFYKEQDRIKFEKYIDRVNKSIERMINFLEDIVLLSKIESKNFELIIDTIKLNQFCQDVVSNVISNNESKSSFDLIIENTINFISDRYLLQIILFRIISNSFKFSKEDSKIQLEVKDEEEFISFVLTDNGQGMSDEILDHIYDPFYLHNSTENHQAVGGFGMTIVKGCVDALSGTIQIESKKDEGTTVIIELPVIQKLDK